MRADYGLYAVAIICFIIAGLPYYYTNFVSQEVLKLDSPISITLTVIFTALGLISIILGYSQRPKPIISIPEAPQPTLPPSPPALQPPEETTEVQVSEPTSPLSIQEEETAKLERKKPQTRTRRKRTRRRRRKA